MALRRFNQSYERERPEDELIDLAIALESSLLFGIEQELSYRLALRGSALLRKRADSEETLRILRTAYQVRSKVVHEGLGIDEQANAGKILGMNATEFISGVRSICSACLHEYASLLGAGQSVSSINEQLETAIRGGLA